MSLAKFKDAEQTFGLMQTSWSQQLDPVIANALINGLALKQVSLSSGPNIINHKLGRNLQGWFITRLRANASLFDTQDANLTPAVTLQLTASAPVVVDLWVF